MRLLNKQNWQLKSWKLREKESERAGDTDRAYENKIERV